jgi:hypothetical protein
LTSPDNGPDDAAERCACDRARSCTDPRKDGARERARAGTDRRSGCSGRYLVIVGWRGCAAAERQTARGGGRNQKMFHLILHCWTGVSVRRMEVRSGQSHEPWRKRNGACHKKDEAEDSFRLVQQLKNGC